MAFQMQNPIQINYKTEESRKEITLKKNGGIDLLLSSLEANFQLKIENFYIPFLSSSVAAISPSCWE